MSKIYLKARGKVNLTLNILNKREDGYHNLKSVFQKINLYDEIWIEKTDNNSFELDSNIQNVKLKDNIIYKAYILLKEEFPSIKGIKVKLNKKIPMQAGLAGGSTDCASFILGINKLFNLNMSKEKIELISAKLGADVVPCLYNRALKAQGIGEIIEEINTNFKYYFVIVKPKVSFSTKVMYEKIDSQEPTYTNTTEKMILSLENNNLNAISLNLYNSFEEVIKDSNEILEVKEELMKNEAMNCLMSGSGSCVFGIFENKEKAKKAYKNLKEKYDIFICTSYNSRRKSFE